jgi:transcription-repair coupling factor (superfamily II helicase)
MTGLSAPLPGTEVALAASQGLGVPALAERIAAGGCRRWDVCGVRGAGTAWLAVALQRTACAPLVLVAADASAAQRLALDVEHFWRFTAPQGAAVAAVAAVAPIAVLLAPEHGPYEPVQADRRATLVRLDTLALLARSAPAFVVTTASALLRRWIPPSAVRDATRTLRRGDLIDWDELVRDLVAQGYRRQALVEDAGTFAVRGGLIDLWPARDREPTRLELIGDELQRLTHFDPETQLTTAPVEAVVLPPAAELLLPTPAAQAELSAKLRELCDSAQYPSSKARRLIQDVVEGRTLLGVSDYLPAAYPLVSLDAYLDRSTFWLIEDPSACVAQLNTELKRTFLRFSAPSELPRFPEEAFYCTPAELLASIETHAHLCVHASAVHGSAPKDSLEQLEFVGSNALEVELHDQSELARALEAGLGERKVRSLAPLANQIRDWQGLGFSIALTAHTHTQGERLAELLRARGLRVRGEDGLGPADALILDSSAPGPEVRVEVGPLTRGLIALAERRVYVTEHEVFGKRAERVTPTSSPKSPAGGLDDLRALKPGDAVVHVEHGVGRYLGLEHKSVGGGTSVDLLVVEYRDGDKLYVPVYRMNQIQKLGAADQSVKLDRLGGVSFAKTKAKVKRRVRDMADALLALYAERANVTRRALDSRDGTYLEFEAAFPYEETTDQASAISDVMRDLAEPRVMDRLICGDVGFGKTEVALRAAFRHILAGNQVALLCPTTILASQHFKTAERRFEGQAVRMDLLSRFRSKNAQTASVLALRQGQTDLVVGTHRLLSKDVHFKRLGLLIVDEEQRFGVAAKERIKQLKKDVDVLTLSATPIPRTLQLAIGGLQDLSVIRTAPPSRRAVRTVTAGFDEPLIQQAVERELDRGGQVYYVHNRIEGLYERARRLQELVPRARVAVGHGQMNADQLERTMVAFTQGDADVLVATAIVESGLDIPRANTLIVDRADLFGLAQLYQLRGRVGRSSERAYCYLLVPPPSQMSDEARMRIEAIARHTELGSGLQLAELDLELRGAGDFLGAEQSGVVQSVGFELFCEMLREATAELRGETVQLDCDPEISLDLEALLPESYVAEVGVRLSLYKRLASAPDERRVSELAVELENRFGPLPRPAQNLVELMQLKASLRALRALSCEASARAVTLHLRHDTPLDVTRLMRLAAESSATYRVTPEGRVVRRPNAREAGLSGLNLASRLVAELSDLVSVPN